MKSKPKSRCLDCVEKDKEIALLKTQLNQDASQRSVVAARAVQRGEIGGVGETLTDVAGELHKVSGRYVRDAMILLREAPDLAEQVEQGKIKIKPAIAKHLARS